MRTQFSALVLLLAIFGCSHPETKKAPSETEGGPVILSGSGALPIIDVHTHTAFSGETQAYSGLEYSLKSYLASMERAGVVGAVSHASRDDGAPPKDLSKHNVIQCYGVGFDTKPAPVEAALKSGAAKCIKIYLGYIYRYANDTSYRALYKLAEKHRVPVVFHTGDTYSTKGKLKFADPLTIDEVAVDFPKVTFVIAHLGNPWIQSAAEVAYKNPNVYIEASALLIGKLDEMPKEKVEEFVVKPLAWAFGYIEDPSKMMFGTDWPLTDMKPYVEAYKKAIPREYWCDVFYNNAVKVFGFKTTHTCQ